MDTTSDAAAMRRVLVFQFDVRRVEIIAAASIAFRFPAFWLVKVQCTGQLGNQT